MKLIDLLIKIEKNEIEPIIYFRINTSGYNFTIKYLYYDFIIEDVYSSFNRSLYKKGESFESLILLSLNKTIEILDNKEKEEKNV